MNLMRKPPMGQKVAKEPRDPEYLASVRKLPCAICFHHGGYRAGDVIQAHHVICGRFGQKKSPDSMAIPLCEGHHQGFWDDSKTAIHKGKKTWVEMYGPDTDYIAWTRDMIDKLETARGASLTRHPRRE